MILHVFNSSVVSGPETLVLPALRDLGEAVQVAFLSEKRKSEASALPVRYARELGLEAFEVPVRSRVDPLAILGLRREIQRRSPRVVHAHDVKASVYSWFASLPGRRWKLVSTHHGVERVGLKLRAYEHFYSGAILRGFDRALAVSTHDRDLLLRRGLPKKKISLHLNGIGGAALTDEGRADRQRVAREAWNLTRLGVPLHSTLLGIVARLDPEKNHSKALDTLAALQRLDPSLPWTLLCFGSGALERELKDKTSSLSLDTRVKWMGYRPHLGEEMAGLDLLLSLSRYEGLPVNLLEAGRAGTPIFASRAGGVTDLIRPGIDGELLPEPWGPEEGARLLLEALRSPSRLREYGKNLKNRVEERFSERAWLEELRKIYAGLERG